MPRSLTALVALAVLATTAASAAAHSGTITTVKRGQLVHLTGKPGGAPGCLASIQYADGATQDSGTKHAVQGVVSWTIRIPNNAAIGLAHWTIRCGPTWHRGGTWRVVKPAPVVPAVPTIAVTNDGFSQRPDSFGSGSKVSFGIFLKNSSATRDAQNVFILVNFVDSTGELLGSMSKTLPLVVAGKSFAYGDEMSLRTQVAVTKLEITVRAGTGGPAVPHPLPHFANVRIVPDQHDPAWLSEVDGEIANDSAPQTMTSAQLSLVVLDANGAIVGGGQSNIYATLPSGSRMVFLAQSGFTDIPTNKASSVVISVVPQYQTG